MNPDNPSYPESSAASEDNVAAPERGEGAEAPPLAEASPERPQGTIIKIAEIQRMNIDQLNAFGKENRPKASRFFNKISNGF